MNILAKKLLSQAAIDDRLYKLRNEVRQTSHLCYNPACPTGQNAIKSHVLQENGILNKIAEHNGNRLEVVEMRIVNLKVANETGQRYQFKVAPITKTSEFTFWGFCSKCDTDLFHSIEGEDPDFSDGFNQLLINYRSLLSELAKKEYNLRYHLAVESGEFPDSVKERFKQLRLWSSGGMLLLQAWKKRIEDSISKSGANNPFCTVGFSLPKFPIAASIILNGALSRLVIPVQNLDDARPWPMSSNTFKIDEQNQNLGFLHLIPRGDSLDIYLSYTSDIKILAGIPVEDIAHLDNAGKQKLISSLIISQGETWCISPSLYRKWQQAGDDQRILDAIRYHLSFERKFDKVEFSLFS